MAVEIESEAGRSAAREDDTKMKKAATVVFSTPKKETNVHFESEEAEVIPL